MSLPDLIPFHGDWQAYENELYATYMETFVNGRLVFRGLPVKVQYTPETKGKGFSFWHAISEGKTEEGRRPDLKRCERIRWIAWLVQHAEIHSDLTWWENERWGNTHVVIWHEIERFAVVLAKRNHYYVLKTAYWVKQNREDDFRRERAEFQRTLKG